MLSLSRCSLFTDPRDAHREQNLTEEWRMKVSALNIRTKKSTETFKVSFVVWDDQTIL